MLKLLFNVRYPMFGVKPTEPSAPARENPLFSGLSRVAGPLSAPNA